MIYRFNETAPLMARKSIMTDGEARWIYVLQ